MRKPLEYLMKLECDLEKLLADYGCFYVEETLTIRPNGYITFSYYFPLFKDKKELSESEVDKVIKDLERLNPDLALMASQIEKDLRPDA